MRGVMIGRFRPPIYTITVVSRMTRVIGATLDRYLWLEVFW